MHSLPLIDAALAGCASSSTSIESEVVALLAR
jgi:hypothetical protein